MVYFDCDFDQKGFIYTFDWYVNLDLKGIACMHENVFYLHLILWFSVYALFVGILFNYFIYFLNVCFKFWADHPSKKRFYTYFKYFESENYFKLHKITSFIK